MSSPSHIKNVAIIGVRISHPHSPLPINTAQGTGQIGSHFLNSLLSTGKHTITALTRQESSATFPSGVLIKKVDYSSSDSITSALQGQDFLIISLATSAPPDQHARIVDAAVAAGVKWILPNYFAYALSGTERTKHITPDTFISQFETYLNDVRKHEKDGVKLLALCCGFWYEFSLGMGSQWFGFDIDNRKVTFYGDGTKKINTSTWNLCGEAIAKVLSLPVEKQGSGPTLNDWANDGLYISSFLVSQRDMLDSLHRVLGTKDEDWEIGYQDVVERKDEGMKEMQSGNGLGFAKAMYALGFYPEGRGDFETGFGTDNGKLRLEKESLDEATKRAIEMRKGGFGLKG